MVGIRALQQGGHSGGGERGEHAGTGGNAAAEREWREPIENCAGAIAGKLCRGAERGFIREFERSGECEFIGSGACGYSTEPDGDRKFRYG